MLAGCGVSFGTGCATSLCKIYIKVSSNLQLHLASKMSMRDGRKRVAPEDISGLMPRFFYKAFTPNTNPFNIIQKMNEDLPK